MKTLVLPITIFVLTLGIGFGMAFALTPTNNPAEHHSGTPARIATDNSVSRLRVAATIDLRDGKATPDQITLKVGEVLQFNAKDQSSYRIALGQGGTEHEHTSATDSGVFGEGEGWRVKFDKPGTYYFHDHFNPAINVLVVVYNPSSKAESVLAN